MTIHLALQCKAAGDHRGMEAAMTEMFKLSVNLIDSLMKLDTLSRGKVSGQRLDNSARREYFLAASRV